MKNDYLILMGEYAIINKRDLSKLTIISPNIQSCVLMIVEDANKIALAHIDSPYANQAFLDAVKAELKLSEALAQMIGGDSGYSLFASSSIYQPLQAFCNQHQIPCEHRYYSYVMPQFFLVGMYLLLRLCSVIESPSWLMFGAYMIGALMCELVVAPMLLSNSYTVSIWHNDEEQQIQLVEPSTPDNTLPVLNHIRLHDPGRFAVYKQRFESAPQINCESMALRRISSPRC